MKKRGVRYMRKISLSKWALTISKGDDIIILKSILLNRLVELSPWSRVLLKELTGSQLVKKFSVFYGTWRFIIAFQNAHHMFLSSASSIQPMPPHSTSQRSILILSSHLCLSLPNGLFLLQVSPPKPCTHLASPPYVPHAPPISFFSIGSLEK